MASSDSVPDSTPARHAQASVILAALDDFLRAAPNREIRIRLDDGAVRIALLECRASRGDSVRDAAAQAATVLLLGGAP